MKKQVITGSPALFKRSRETEFTINRLISTNESILYVHGPAGTGKTTLIDEIIQKLKSLNYRDEDTACFDFSLLPPQKQVSMLAQLAKSLNTIPKLVVLDGLHNPAPLISTLEITLGKLAEKTKVIFAARVPPPAGWSVSPLLGPQTAVLAVKDLSPQQAENYLRAAGLKDTEQVKKAMQLSGCRPVVLADIINNVNYYRREDALRPALARQITERFLSETSDTALRGHIETAAAAWRFNRDLLAHVNGTITPLAFRHLQSLSFIYTDPETGLYPDPVLRRAILSGMNPQTRENLRAAIHSFSLQEYPGQSAVPMHVLNALYTLPGNDFPRELFCESPPGAEIKRVDGEKAVTLNFQNFFVTASRIVKKPLPGLVGSPWNSRVDTYCVIASGVTAAVAATAEWNENLAKETRLTEWPAFTERRGSARVLLYLAYKRGHDWAVSFLARHFIASGTGRARIIVTDPSPLLMNVLHCTGAIRVKDSPRVYLLDLTERTLPSRKKHVEKNPRHIPKENLIDATRKTLRQWHDPTKTGPYPLLDIWRENAGPGEKEKENASREFASHLAASLQKQKEQDPLTARALEVLYLKRSTTLRQLSAELGVPERTMYRKIQNAIYELGREVLEKMKGG